MSKSSSFFEGIILGSIIGFLAGILFAPNSGEETRERLKKMKDDNDELIKDTKVKTEEMVAKTVSAIDQGFKNINRLVEEKTDKK